MQTELSFAPWWVHESVELVETNDELWLVGKGHWHQKDIFGSTGDVDPLREIRLAHSFASIRTAEQAHDFAQQFGLLGLLAVEDCLVVDISGDWKGWKRNEAGLKIRPSGIRGVMDNEEYTLEEAPTVLMQTPKEFQITLRHLWPDQPWIPLFYPEPVSRWLELASAVRGLLGSDEGPHFSPLITRAGAEVAWSASGEFTFADGRSIIAYDRLLKALVLEAHFVKANGVMPRECGSPGCSRWFTPRNKTGEYCSASCRRSAQNARAYRRRRARQLHADGQSPEDIAASLNVSVQDVKEWIEQQKEGS